MTPSVSLIAKQNVAKKKMQEELYGRGFIPQTKVVVVLSR